MAGGKVTVQDGGAGSEWTFWLKATEGCAYSDLESKVGDWGSAARVDECLELLGVFDVDKNVIVYLVLNDTVSFM